MPPLVEFASILGPFLRTLTHPSPPCPCRVPLMVWVVINTLIVMSPSPAHLRAPPVGWQAPLPLVNYPTLTVHLDDWPKVKWKRINHSPGLGGNRLAHLFPSSGNVLVWRSLSLKDAECRLVSVLHYPSPDYCTWSPSMGGLSSSQTYTTRITAGRTHVRQGGRAGQASLQRILRQYAPYVVVVFSTFDMIGLLSMCINLALALVLTTSFEVSYGPIFNAPINISWASL
jgi:hypothetical protein